jgi:hypothetical protein
MNKLTIIVAISTLAFAACENAARATEGIRASVLVKECQTDAKACEEYLLGVWDGIVLMQEMTHSSTVVVCPKTGPTGTELHHAFDNWAKDNPDKFGLSRLVGATLAEKHAFPCR